MPRFRTIDDLDVAGRTVLLRVDFNVPMADGRVSDATRIERAAPTIQELLGRGARVAILSHLGRPKGQRTAELSLRPLIEPLSACLGGAPVAFAEDCVGDAAETAVRGLGGGQAALLENLRFHAGEEANDPAFAADLAALGEVYVNDAFSAAHRAHASVEALAHLLPAAAGRQAVLDTAAVWRIHHTFKPPVLLKEGGAPQALLHNIKWLDWDTPPPAKDWASAGAARRAAARTVDRIGRMRGASLTDGSGGRRGRRGRRGGGRGRRRRGRRRDWCASGGRRRRGWCAS